MIHLAIISAIKARKDKDSPKPRMRKAGARFASVKTRVSLSGGTSVLHFSVEGKYFFFIKDTIPAAFIWRTNL